MIAEQTAMQNPTPSAMTPATFISVSPAGTCTASPSPAWRTRVQGVANRAQTLMISVLAALAASSSPTYFDLERQGPVEHRLGPGLSRESDSFWPLSNW
jgi:hypothetical protein